MPENARKQKKRVLCVLWLLVAQDFDIRSICRETCLKAKGRFRKLEQLQGSALKINFVVGVLLGSLVVGRQAPWIQEKKIEQNWKAKGCSTWALIRIKGNIHNQLLWPLFFCCWLGLALWWITSGCGQGKPLQLQEGAAPGRQARWAWGPGAGWRGARGEGAAPRAGGTACGRDARPAHSRARTEVVVTINATPCATRS